MNDLIKYSKEIYDKSILDFKPKATVMMLSGGDDSMTAYHVAKELGIKFDLVIHGNTRTGVPDTTEFVIKEVGRMGDKLIIADAKDAYEKYVMRKGFFGKGNDAHTFTYHLLKIEHFRKVVSQELRKRQRNFPILFINGARRKESENRMKTMISPYKTDPSQNNNIWVNIINEFDKHECLEYLNGNSICRNPVSINLCRSGECMCGTMQSKGDREEASFYYPLWGRWLNELEKEVMKKFPWSWNDNINKYHLMERDGQLNMFSDFQPMCTGCKVQYEKSKENETISNMATSKKVTTKTKPSFKTIPTGTLVSYHYRSAVGSGTIAGIHKKGTNAGNTEYSIREHDHHKGEPAIVFHYGKALTRKSKK